MARDFKNRITINGLPVPDISGIPNAGDYARWVDANTLEPRTTAQVLSDIGVAQLIQSPEWAAWAAM